MSYLHHRDSHSHHLLDAVHPGNISEFNISIPLPNIHAILLLSVYEMQVGMRPLRTCLKIVDIQNMNIIHTTDIEIGSSYTSQ